MFDGVCHLVCQQLLKAIRAYLSTVTKLVHGQYGTKRARLERLLQ